MVEQISRQINPFGRNCRLLVEILSMRKITPYTTFWILISGCAGLSNHTYELELTGKPSTQCKITHDQEIIGTFTVPSTVKLGSEVGTVEANCTINNKTVVSKIQAANAQCQDQIVVKGPCPKPTSTVESVEIIIRQSR